MSDRAPRGEDSGQAGGPSQGHHLATVSHGGRFWDVYVEFDEDPGRRDSYAACLCYSPADGEEGEPSVRTAPILIEASYEEVLHRARTFEDRQLVGLLRSCLPE